MNIVVDVACKFDIFNAEYVDKLFKFVIVELPVNEFIIFNYVVDVLFKFDVDVLKLFIEVNNDVDVVFRFDIDKDDVDDKLVKSVLNEPVERFKLDIDVLILFIDKVDDDDTLFKFVWVAYTVKSGLFVIEL